LKFLAYAYLELWPAGKNDPRSFVYVVFR